MIAEEQSDSLSKSDEAIASELATQFVPVVEDAPAKPTVEEPTGPSDVIIVQGKHTGRCRMCGSGRQHLVNLKFEDHFGVAERKMCFNCFRKYSPKIIL